MRIVDLDMVFDVPVLVYKDDELSRLRAIVRRLETAPAINLKSLHSVRCRDCVKRHTTACALWYGMLNETHFLLERGDDFWCAWGERREENAAD